MKNMAQASLRLQEKNIHEKISNEPLPFASIIWHNSSLGFKWYGGVAAAVDVVNAPNQAFR